MRARVLTIFSGDPNGQPAWVRALADGDDEGFFGPGSAVWEVHNGIPTVVAGIRCREVLADLSEYLDGTLPAARVHELRAHLQGCDNCSRFGGAVAGVLGRLRQALPASDADYAGTVIARIAGVSGRALPP